MAYAENTTVSVEKSKAEIERLVTRYGADEFLSASSKSMAMIAFRINGLMVEIRLNLPDPDDQCFRSTPGGRRQRNADSAYKAWEKACRSKWRSLFLVIKAKLEAVDSEISTFEREFLPDVVIDYVNGQRVTMGDKLLNQLPAITASGKLPNLLPAGSVL